MIWPVGKVVVAIILWTLVGVGVIEGQDSSTVTQDDFDALQEEVIELRKIKKIHQQQHPQGEKNYKMKE